MSSWRMWVLLSRGVPSVAVLGFIALVASFWSPHFIRAPLQNTAVAFLIPGILGTLVVFGVVAEGTVPSKPNKKGNATLLSSYEIRQREIEAGIEDLDRKGDEW